MVPVIRICRCQTASTFLLSWGGQKVDAAKPEETGEIEEATEGEDTAESIEIEESEEVESEVDDTEENESEETVANDAEFDSDSEEESTEENSEEKEKSTEENSEEETSASEKTDESFDQEEGVDETEDFDNVDMSENDAEEDEDGFWRKIKVTWVLDEEESQASSYDGKTPGVYLFRAKQKSSNYVVDEEELPTIQITVMEKGQETTALEFVPLEETVAEQYLSIGSKESDIQLPEQLTIRETTGEETTERILTGITWKLDAENSTYSEFQGGLALEDYFDHFTEDGEPEETEEKTWEGYEKANEEYNGASYTYLPVIPDKEEIQEETSLPEIHVQVGEAGIAVYSSRITGSGKEDDPYLVCSNEDWVTVTMQSPYSNSGNLKGCIRLEGDIEFDKLDADVQAKTLNLNDKTFDGNGYSIKNLTKPLFGVANGTVKNLVLSGVSIKETSNGKHVGAIARAVTGALTVENCYVTGSTDSEAFIANRGNCAAGGLIGQVQSDSGSVTIKNCVVHANVENTGTVSNGSLAGGLVGSVSTNNRLNIENCIAMGNVSTTSGQGAGGLVGGQNRRVTIQNSAALQKSVSTGSRSGCVGRIFGYSNDGNDYVTGDHNYAYAGMKGGYNGDGIFPSISEHNVGNADKKKLLTKEFWNETIGWAGNTSWTIDEEGQLPTLKTTNGKVIFSGADIPEYLENTDQVTGTVTDGTESGIEGAELTFKKGSSEKTASTHADGDFQIDLANGTYDVTIKKIGYFTNTIQNVTIPGTLTFTLEENPVSMNPDQIVTGTFQTTDAADVTADGELALIYTGTEGLSADDFILSSEQDGNAYDEIKIVAVDTISGEGTKLKIQFAKSLDLGNANEKTLYVHYKESLIGSFTLIRQVNAVQLAKPDGVKWDETIKGRAVWSPVSDAAGYKVQLYKDGSPFGNEVELSSGETSYNFTSQIADGGTYAFKVRATGDATYGDSPETFSDEYRFAEQTLADVKAAAEAALQAMSVTNETTDAELLKVVKDVITNKNIRVNWSAADGFKITPATDGEDPGREGSITGTIVLSYQSDDTETVTITVNLSIAAKYQLTYESGRDDSHGDAPTSEHIPEGTVITLPDNPFTVYGMDFTGWSDGTTTYTSGASYTMPAGNVTLKAIWNQGKWDGKEVKKPEIVDGYYQISTGAELAYFQGSENRAMQKAKLMCDIDLGGHPFVPISNHLVELDGCGHTIRGLKTVKNGIYTGLFRDISSTATIQNLTIENAEIENTSTDSDAQAGIIVANVYGDLTVKNCYVSGTITGTNAVRFAGGLIGHVHSAGSVKIESCYANPQVKKLTDGGFAGGLIGYATGKAVIENSYAVVDMDVDHGTAIGGLVGHGNSGSVTISNSYATGEALTKAYVTSSAAGISNNGSISNSVSIFPEMTSLNRIGVASKASQNNFSNNYGFGGMVAKKANGTILTPSADEIGADKPYGEDASAEQLKDQAFYESLGWNFESVWTMDQTGGYAFPILKEQTVYPTLNLDLTAAVRSITLDKTSATIYQRGNVQLTATVDAVNGASREIIWTSSDPAVKVKNGLVTASESAVGTYTITATSAVDPSQKAECQIMVDNTEHAVMVKRIISDNSLNAKANVYASLEDAISGENPIGITGDVKGAFTFAWPAGKKIYLAFTDVDSEDLVSRVEIADANGSKVNVQLCNMENPAVYCFTMPCSDTSVQVSYAENMNAYQYTWFVGQEWSTWGTTATYETTSWSGSHIGSLKVTGIINGRKFKQFDVKSMSVYKGAPITPKMVGSKAELSANGDYCEEYDTDGLPVLWVYLDGPGMVSVDIDVENDENAEFNITQKPGNRSSYTLNTYKAKAGETITATLTEEGVRRMQQVLNQNVVFTYSGGLTAVVFPPKFTESNGIWTASLKMPALDIETDVIFGEKQKVVLSGDAKKVDYDGTPKSIHDQILAEINGTNISELLQDDYEVQYEGVDGTSYSSKTPPTNAGTYSCTVGISESNLNYMADPITVRLTIRKSVPKTPKAPLAAAQTENSITLKAPASFVDETAISEDCQLEYCLDQGEWQDSPVFAGLMPETAYHFYVRVKAGTNNEASAASEAVILRTLEADKTDPVKPDPVKPDPVNPEPSKPEPTKPGTSDSGNSHENDNSSRDKERDAWVKEGTGWKYCLVNGTYFSGKTVQDPATGKFVEQVAWKKIRNAWWAFGADGYLRTGWVYDYSAGKWYYVDENAGMKTGWYLDPQDDKWYYLDQITGEMLTDWQWIADWGYMYLNPYAPQPTWTYDEESKKWSYIEGVGRPYGSLYMDEWTPDGYYVNKDGVWDSSK